MVKPRVSACIYIEGGARGADSKHVNIRCAEAFRKLLDRMRFAGRQPKLVASGGRDAVFSDFRIAHKAAKADFIAMWIDSEEPISDINAAWAHLENVTTVTNWDRPDGALDEQVLFMTTCMETWILADRETIREHFRQGFNENQLPAINAIEGRLRDDVQARLVNATKNCQNAYEKGKRSYAIVGKLNPDVLQQLPSFARVARILNERLPQ